MESFELKPRMAKACASCVFRTAGEPAKTKNALDGGFASGKPQEIPASEVGKDPDRSRLEEGSEDRNRAFNRQARGLGVSGRTGSGTLRYIALLTPEDVGFSVSFPDLPGCFSEGDTADEAVQMATEALSLYAQEMDELPAPSSVADLQSAAEGAVMAFVPLIRNTGKNVRVNLSMDSGVLAAIDAAAADRGVTRSSFLSGLALREIAG